MLTQSISKRAFWRALAAWLVFSAALAWFAPFPFIEELPSLDIAAWPEAQAGVLHRYGHIYLLKAFVAVAPSPLWGARLFWGAAVGGILTLMMSLAARLNAHQPRLASFAAILLFLGGFFRINRVGAIFPELTTTLGTLLGLGLYLNAVDEEDGRQRPWLALFGFVLVWTVRSSGAGWLLVLLLPGLAWRLGMPGRVRALLGGLGWVILGALGAMLVFVGLDGLLLNDALFSLRPGNQFEAAAAIYALPAGGYRALALEHFLGGGLGHLTWTWMLRAGLVLWLPLMLGLAMMIRRWRHTPPAWRALYLLPWGWLLAEMPFAFDCNDPTARYYYSGCITTESEGLYLDQTPSILVRMMNIWFQCSTGTEHFTAEREPNLPGTLLEVEAFDVGFLSATDYAGLTTEEQDLLAERYEVFAEAGSEFVYLRARQP